MEPYKQLYYNILIYRTPLYINHSADVRMDDGIKIELGSFMIRTARHAKDYTGGNNQYCDMLQLQSMIDKLLS